MRYGRQGIEKGSELSENQSYRLGPSREEAIADGKLIDVTAVALRAGLGYRTAITRAVWNTCVQDPEPVAGDTCDDRLWTLLHSLRVTHRNTKPESDEVAWEVWGHVSVRAVSMPTRVITVLLADEDLPFVTPEREDADNGKKALPRNVLRAIETVIRYLWNDERRACSCAEREPATQHVFNALITVRNWLDDDTLTIDSLLNEE
jgi:hypothetical protein